ncbi:MAG: hypothetical protein WEE03_08385 [Chloroflexota bacterium]
MGDDTIRDAGPAQVAETVRRALLLVGPSERGVERLKEEPAQPAEIEVS